MRCFNEQLSNCQFESCSSDELKIFSTGSDTTGNTSFSNFVGTGSNINNNDLD